MRSERLLRRKQRMVPVRGLISLKEAWANEVKEITHIYYGVIQRFLEGQSVPPNMLLKEVDSLIYATAKRLHRRFTVDVIKELRSMYVHDLYATERPVPEPEQFMYARAKRVVYSVRTDTIPLETVAHTLTSFQHDNEKDDFLLPVMHSAVHPEFIDTYKQIVETLDKDALVQLSSSNTLLGNVCLSALFGNMGTNFTHRYKKVERYIRQPGSSINLTLREEEVLLGAMCVKIEKKWALPEYILMKDGFFLSLFTFMGPALAPGLKYYFKNIYHSVKVYCAMEGYMRSYDEEQAVKLAGRRFAFRQRDIRNRYTRIGRILRKYDRWNQSCCRQIRKDIQLVTPK